MDEAVDVEVTITHQGTVTVQIGELSHDRHTGLGQTAARDLILKTARSRGPLRIASHLPDGKVITELMERDGTLVPLQAVAARVRSSTATEMFALTDDEVSPAEHGATTPQWSSVQDRFDTGASSLATAAAPAGSREDSAGLLATLGVAAQTPKRLAAGRAQALDPSINEGRDRFGRLIVDEPEEKGRKPAGGLSGLFGAVTAAEAPAGRPDKPALSLDDIFTSDAVEDGEPTEPAPQPSRRRRVPAAPDRDRMEDAAAPAPELPAAPVFDPTAADRLIAQTRSKAETKAAEEKARRTRSTRFRNLSLIAAGAIALIAVVVIAVTQLLGAGEKTGVDYTEVDALTVGEAVKVLPGFAEDPVWDRKISENAAVTAFPEAVVVAEGKKLELFSPADGKPIRTINTDEAVEYSFTAMVGDRQVLGFKTGSKLVLWPADAGAKGTLIEVDLTATGVPMEDLKVTAAGRSLLIRDESGQKNWTITDKGLVRLHSTLAGQTVMGVDGDEMILSSLGSPQAFRTQLDGSDPRKTELQAPAEGLEALRWISAGFGRAVVAWAPDEQATEWALTVHSLDDGSVISSVPVTAADTQDKAWIRGVGRDTASFGPYLFSMADGALLTDGSEMDVDFTKVYGHYGQAITTEGLAYAVEDTIHPSQSQLLSVTDDTAIVMTDATTISSYQRTSGEV